VGTLVNCSDSLKIYVYYYLKFYILMTRSYKVSILSVVKLFSLVDIYRCFGEMFCHHIQGKIP